MPNYQLPLVDYENPCYCPEVSADSYFETLLDRFDGFAFSREDIQISSFADMLCNYANEDGMLDLLQSRKDRVVRKQNPFQYPPGRARKKPITNASLAPEAALISRSKYPSIMDGHQATLHQAKSKKRKLPFNDQRESFTDIVAPVKRGRSSVSVNVASFDFSDPGDPPIFAKSGYDSSSSRGSSEERTCVTPFAGPSEYIKQAVSVDSRLKSLEGFSNL
ncbi:hypothetical protein JAAARDRAFT_649682 [Jaapia argillacea MUCL 33604]|uniref:Uncharacterized protein n=1 Tax=Jaapia argillacea MUCL 33604 TaxID=933084 RepID=A0A067PVZ5_9AGAM|nr:hypothetical protein JAAARDRAFT_649682 [Jaapia argillacea MUCL 33604]